MGLGYVSNADGVSDDFIAEGQFEIGVAGVKYRADVSLRPLYDPKNKGIRS